MKIASLRQTSSELARTSVGIASQPHSLSQGNKSHILLLRNSATLVWRNFVLLSHGCWRTTDFHISFNGMPNAYSWSLIASSYQTCIFSTISSITIVPPLLHPSMLCIYATRFPRAFFFGVSVMVKSVRRCKLVFSLAVAYVSGGIWWLWCRWWKRTWWERLLELLNLLGILQDQGVEVSLASDLELDLGGLLVALDACSCL